jgi:UDPglucose 6-dehydrogenase
LVVGTEWEEFATLDLAKIKEVMAYPVIVDGRNLFEPAAVAAAGFAYYPVGRPPIL